MKAKKLFSLLVVLFLSANIFANGGRETIVFSNVDKSATGYVKEFIKCDKKTSTPLIKNVYEYDDEGRMLVKTIYKRCNKNGWIGIQKFEYNYDDNNQPQTPNVMTWDAKLKSWCTESDK